jgi:hypothetical protein
MKGYNDSFEIMRLVIITNALTKIINNFILAKDDGGKSSIAFKSVVVGYHHYQIQLIFLLNAAPGARVLVLVLGLVYVDFTCVKHTNLQPVTIT